MKTLLLATAAAAASTLAFAGDADHTGHHVTLDGADWFDAPVPGVKLAQLWGDDDTGARWYFQMEPGVAIPMHRHTHDYWGITIQGNWVHIEEDGTEIPTSVGDYAFVKGGAAHADRCDGDVPCLGLLDFAGPRDVALVD